MSSKQISPLLRTWYKWKALRLPWRKRFLVGLDLQGNTYWEFRDVRHGPAELSRWRRIVQYPRDTHYGEVKVSPQWHQWLRHMRERPPSIQEQHIELQRQHQMKRLAAEADARWEAKPRMMDAPGEEGTGQPVPALESRVASAGGEKAGEAGVTRKDAIASGDEQVEAQKKPLRKETATEDPWKKHTRAGPSEDWQPQAWAPPASKR
ncbi:hypothetical protein N0V93_005732 [Gnomoniopsis smithogilvyi]|uniref:NADH dehydrogenase [ubiquinone] 1 alpha subcomplex subunit n=1 Tax=Gnomoniopsis smithogilvyi TaxID=1191159 RepID=A0A9W8YW53_9PEZI|nr:hypothetical protein N0V93_005732 [Gnomoniopsis smithogilvyi]